MHHRQAKPVESGPTWRLAFAYTEAAPSNGTQQQEPYSLWELQYLSSPSPSLPLPLSLPLLLPLPLPLSLCLSVRPSRPSLAALS